MTVSIATPHKFSKKNLNVIQKLANSIKYENKLTVINVNVEEYRELKNFLNLNKIKFFVYILNSEGQIGFKMVAKNLPEDFLIKDIKRDLQKHPDIIVLDIYQVKQLPMYVVNFAPMIDRHEILNVKIFGYTVEWDEFNPLYKTERRNARKMNKEVIEEFPNQMGQQKRVNSRKPNRTDDQKDCELVGKNTLPLRQPRNFSSPAQVARTQDRTNQNVPRRDAQPEGFWGAVTNWVQTDLVPNHHIYANIARDVCSIVGVVAGRK